MNLHRTSRLAPLVPLVGLGLALAACSSGGGTTATGATGGNASSTTGAGGGAVSTTGGGGGGAAAGSPTEVCDRVPAATVATATGLKVTEAKPISAGDRFRSANTLPGCNYRAGQSGAVLVEFLPCADMEGITTDPVAARTDLTGVGDSAKARADAIDATKIIDVAAKKGDQCVYIRYYTGVSKDTAVSLTNQFWKG